MDKEFLKMVLDTENLNTDQKTEIILKAIEHDNVTLYQPYDFTKGWGDTIPPSAPNWQEPQYSPLTPSGTGWPGNVMCSDAKMEDIVREFDKMKSKDTQHKNF